MHEAWHRARRPRREGHLSILISGGGADAGQNAALARLRLHAVIDSTLAPDADATCWQNAVLA